MIKLKSPNITHGGPKYDSEWFLVVDNRNDCSKLIFQIVGELR